MARGPIWSREEANATRPYLDTRPYVGFNPTTPQSAAGCLIEPPVSEPSEQMAVPEATAAAGPPLEPPVGAVVAARADESRLEPGDDIAISGTLMPSEIDPWMAISHCNRKPEAKDGVLSRCPH